MDLHSLYQEAYRAAQELLDAAAAQPGQILVVGCSTSEIAGATIGKDSQPELAVQVYKGIAAAAQEHGVAVAAQCCEHLNRAIILDQSVAERKNLEIVSVVPWPKAGGSFATAAYQELTSPVAVEHIQANIGMDIGDTLIGMHLKPVAVPVRLSIDSIGHAHLVCARTRPKYIGGERAHYK